MVVLKAARWVRLMVELRVQSLVLRMVERLAGSKAG